MTEEVVDWLSTNKGHVIFCFPPNLLGPDLLFLSDHDRSQKVEKWVFMKAVRTVLPDPDVLMSTLE